MKRLACFSSFTKCPKKISPVMSLYMKKYGWIKTEHYFGWKKLDWSIQRVYSKENKKESASNLFRAYKMEKKSRKKLKTQLAVRPGIWLENIGSKYQKGLFKRKKILPVWILFRAYKMEEKKIKKKAQPNWLLDSVF